MFDGFHKSRDECVSSAAEEETASSMGWSSGQKGFGWVIGEEHKSALALAKILFLADLAHLGSETFGGHNRTLVPQALPFAQVLADHVFPRTASARRYG